MRERSKLKWKETFLSVTTPNREKIYKDIQYVMLCGMNNHWF